MQSIIVEVYVPALTISFDFRLPATGKIGDLTQEMINVLERTQQNIRFDREQPMLCDRDRGIVLKREDTVAEAGLRDSAQLMLL